MFKKKEDKNIIDIKKGIELVKEAEESLIILNDKRGYIEGTPYYVYNTAMNLIGNLIDSGVLNVGDIVKNFADGDEHIVKICAEDKKDALKQLDKEVKRMKDIIKKKIEEEEDK